MKVVEKIMEYIHITYDTLNDTITVTFEYFIGKKRFPLEV